MPGITVVTGPAPSATSDNTARGATLFAVGLAERGSTTLPIRVRSMAEFVERLGGRVTYGWLYDTAAAYFADGGIEAQFARLTGPAATVGASTLMDRAGTPLATLRIDALDAGAWSGRLSRQISDGTITNTFRIDIYLDGVLVEAYPDLASPAAAVTALASSGYVRGVNLSSVSAAPTNNPAVSALTAVSAGTDDRASLVTADYTAALSRFNPDLGSGVVAIPGMAATLVGTALIAHARANNRIALTSPGIGTATAGARTAAVPMRGIAGSEGAALYWPWVVVPDGSGGERTIPPEGTVAGVRARTFATVGPWQAPAGKWGESGYVLRPESTVDRATADSLDTDAVNVIRVINGTTRVYGDRSLSTDLANYRLLTGREMLNYVATEAARVLEDRVFGTIDARGHFAAGVYSDIKAILEPLRAGGGLYERIDANGALADPGYAIDVGPGVNTAAVLAADTFKAIVGIRVSPTASLIFVTVAKVGLTTALAA